MMKPGKQAELGKTAAAIAVAAGVAIAVPSAVYAVNSGDMPTVSPTIEFAPFTPASVDPELAKRVEQSMRDRGLDLRFTPGSSVRDRTVTVAIRVNDEAAQAISARSFGSRRDVTVAAASSSIGPGIGSVAIAPTRYNLGIARGYQSFAQSPGPLGSALGKPGLAKPTLPKNIKSVDMPDLADFKPSPGAADKPSRFKSRVALDQDTPTGRSPQTRGSLGDQSFDLGGAYRVTKNLDVTAGVRLSQDRDRLDPLTDDVQDSQAVYVGTQFRF
ncbi:MAG: hypothetical protein WA908_06880 [Pontixanthobacter sp.]